MLRHDLSDAEIAEAARSLSTKVEDKACLEEEKKNVASSYKNRIDILDNEINQNSRLISCGYEMRMTECHVFFDDPENGHKRIVRTDTGETLRIEKMAQHEMQKELPLEEATEAKQDEEEGEHIWKDPAKILPDCDTLVLCRLTTDEGEEEQRCTYDESGTPEWLTDDFESVGTDRVIAWRHITDEELEGDDGWTRLDHPGDIPEYDRKVEVRYVDFAMDRCTAEGVFAEEDGDPVFLTGGGSVLGIGDIQAWRPIADEADEAEMEEDKGLEDAIEKATAALVKRGRIGITEIQNVTQTAYLSASRIYDEMVERGIIDKDGNPISKDVASGAVSDDGEIEGQVLVSGHDPYKAKIGLIGASSTAGARQAAEAVIAKVHPGCEVTELVELDETEQFREGGPKWKVWNFTIKVA